MKLHKVRPSADAEGEAGDQDHDLSDVRQAAR
jgi:hypothetical protein